MNWTVKVYSHGEVIGQWRISDRNESEAFKEAEADIRQYPQADDWSLVAE